jgi:type IV secretion system protein VirB10
MDKKRETPASPTRLEKPKTPRATLQKRPVIIGAVVMGLVGLFIFYNIFNASNTRKKSVENKEGSAALTPALHYADTMVNQITSVPPLMEQKSDRRNMTLASEQVVLPPLEPPKENLERLSRLDEEKEKRFEAALQAGSSVERFEKINIQLESVEPNITSRNRVPTEQNDLDWGNPASTTAELDPNNQVQKRAFLEKLPSQNGRYLAHTREKALSPLELKTGAVIPAVMIDGINSDLPGDIIAQVSENVYDTICGCYLLIPQGSKLYGTYQSQITYGQQGVLVVWRRIVYPDGSTLEIENMGGSDQGGYAGFRDQVNNHYTRTFGFGLLTSLFSAAFQLSQPQEQTENGVISPQQTIAAAVGQNMTQLGIDLARKNMQVQPTIIIRNGYRFVVKVNKDIIFPQAYTL